MRDENGILHLYIFGGLSNEGTSNDLHSFNTKTQVWTYWPNNSGIIQPGRQSPSLVAHDGYLYLWGGGISSPDFAREDTYRYDFELMGWYNLNIPGPVNRCYAGIALIEDCIYYVYGWNQIEQIDHDGIDKFNITTLSWSEMEIDRSDDWYQKIVRDDYAWIQTGGVMYIQGGFTSFAGLTNSLASVDLK